MEQTGTKNDHGVHVGLDDYLFLEGGAHGVFSYFTGAMAPSATAAEVFAANLESRQALCARTGRLFRMVVFPEKCVALRNNIASEENFESLYRRSYEGTLQTSPALRAVRYPIAPLDDHQPAFSRTDTHYGVRGNLGVTQAITADIFPDLQEKFEEMTFPHIQPRSGFSGDLGRKFTPHRIETDEALRNPPVPTTMTTNGVQSGNDGICILTSSPQALTNKTLLIFGDSFFRQILGLLAVFYRRVIFCRTRFFHTEMVEAARPDHIFCGVAERYLSGVRPDKDRPHFLSYPLALGRATKPDPGFGTMWQEFIDRKALIS